ncbi:MAG TPA: hypothetical protein VMB26_06925 [Candidatus Binataceae bacterium]|nr:hypothetical protein [Candidatus Binataceae bacterium]
MSPRITIYSIASLTAGLAALILALGPGSVAGEGVHHPVTVDIKSVLAADTNEGFDERLGPMSRPLGMLFHYSTYRLISHEAKRTECGRMLSFNLPGGRILHVEPRGVDDNMIELEVVLFQGERPQLSTDFHMMNRGTLLLGGPHYKEGMLIISIGAATVVPAATTRRHRLPFPVATPHPSLNADD